ncbi:MAG TPA: zinc metalloprotease [Intrasporangium sp.]|nr:zinc metalloprotease [Intrasporangium sp.]
MFVSLRRVVSTAALVIASAAIPVQGPTSTAGAPPEDCAFLDAVSGSAVAAARGGPGDAREPRGMAGEEVPAGSKRDPARFAVTVPTYFHVIRAGLKPEEGNLTDAQVDRQMEVLNRAFAGRYGGAETGFRFDLVGVTRTTNAEWFAMGYQSRAEHLAKSALRQGDEGTLNIYSTDGADQTLLGWATFPSKNRGQPLRDGVVINHGSVPGGFIDGFNLGQTATHEVGHWLGLYHTFQNRCSTTGDRVEDTPRQRVPTFGCPKGKDTCRQPGTDPIHNFMDYSDDSCYEEFTAGQATRMTEQFLFYRS